MKLALNIFGGLLMLVGLIWFLQGIGVLLGSFMSNTTQWTLIGIVVLILGGGLLFYNNRRKTSV